MGKYQGWKGGNKTGESCQISRYGSKVTEDI